MQTTSRPRRSALALVAVAALALGACSAGGDNDSSDDPTTTVERTATTAGGDTSTTVEQDDDDTTTTVDGGGDAPSEADLEALLPTAADIGSGWQAEADDDDDSGSDTDEQLDEQCPEVAAFDDLSDDDQDVEAEFANADNQRVAVKLNPTAKDISDEELDDYVAAVNACEGSIEDDDDGTTTEFTFDVSRTDEFGDQGVQVESVITISGGRLPKPATITLYTLNYRIGTVGVEVSGQDGIDNSTFDTVPFDPDQLVTLGRDLEAQVEDLVGG